MFLYRACFLGSVLAMNEDPSPYAVSESAVSSEQVVHAPPAMPSSIPKVFGIINIVYGALGMFSAVASVGALALMKSIIPEGQLKEFDALMKAYEGIAHYAYIDVVIKVVLGLVLIVAGIGLLRKRSWAAGTTIFWAVARMVIAIAMVFVMAAPVRVFQEKVNEIGPAGGPDMQKFQEMANGAGNVMTIVMVSIYPILCIIFLSKKRVKQSLR